MSALRIRRSRTATAALAAMLLSAASPIALGAKPPATPVPPKKVVLVEAQGSEALVDPFISRFLSEVSDRSDIAIVDARLSGAHMSELKLSPPTEEAKAFKAAWPADLYLSVNLPDCTTKGSQNTVQGFNDPMTGARTYETIRNVWTECPATATLIDAKDGKVVSSATVTGQRKENPEDPDTASDPTSAAEQEGAEKAAKKLFGARKK
ncbi:MAG: hypothetical protein ABIT01_18475 [Thermoanaerobaculia bacterium]